MGEAWYWVDCILSVSCVSWILLYIMPAVLGHWLVMANNAEDTCHMGHFSLFNLTGWCRKLYRWIYVLFRTLLVMLSVAVWGVCYNLVAFYSCVLGFFYWRKNNLWCLVFVAIVSLRPFYLLFAVSQLEWLKVNLNSHLCTIQKYRIWLHLSHLYLRCL